MSVNHDYNEELEVLIQPAERPLSSFWVTVELPVFLLLFSSSLTDNVTYNLLLYRTCIVDLEYNSTKCALLNILNKTNEAKALETEVQGEASPLIITLSVVSSIMPAILTVFLGAWSDKYGRKPLVVWPLFGQSITTVLTVVFSKIQYLSAYWFVICALPFALFGGASAVILGANLLITDIAKEEHLSFRLAFLQGSGFAGVLLGTVASSYVYDAMGYGLLYSLSASIYFLTLFYTFVLVKETLGVVESVTGMLSMLGSLAAPLIRSQITKVLARDEVAKMFSLVGCVEAIVPIFAPTLFNLAYCATLADFPGFIYVISGGFFTVCLVLVIIANSLYYRLLKSRDQERIVLVEDEYN